MRLRSLLAYFCLLPLAACTRSCEEEYDNASEFANAQLPPYSETGANTLGCQLGTQTWTVLGATEIPPRNEGGRTWMTNLANSYLEPDFPASPPLNIFGTMTGVRDSRVFYDTQIRLLFEPTDTLGGQRLLGDYDITQAPAARQYEHLRVIDHLHNLTYTSRSQRPVRLLVRKLDRQQRIISGTFEGYVYGGASGNDSLAVTNGRFDFRYR